MAGPFDFLTRSRVSGFRNAGVGSFRRSNLSAYRPRRTGIREAIAGSPGFGAERNKRTIITSGERYYLDAMRNRQQGLANPRDRPGHDAGEDLGDASDDYQMAIRDRPENLHEGAPRFGDDLEDDLAADSDVTFTDEEAGVITGSAPKKKKSKKKTKAAKKIDAQGGSALVDKSAGASPVAEKVSFLGFPVSRSLVPGFLQSTGAQLLLLLLVGGGATYFIARRMKKKGGRSSVPATASNPGRPSKLESSGDRDVAKAARFRREFHWGNPARRVVRRSVAVPPRVLADLGEVASITYRTNKRGEKAQFFEHEFEGRRPRLGVDPRSKRLHLVGGSYTVKAAGITG